MTTRIRTCPSIARTVAAASAAGVSALALALAAPIAHADDVPIRSAVDSERGASACPALNYRDDLAGAAYAFARGGTVPTNGYPGHVVGFKGAGDPAAEATSHAVGSARSAIRDCKYQAFGVSLLRNENTEWDVVAIVLGEQTPKSVPIPILGSIAGSLAGTTGTAGSPSPKLDSPQPKLDPPQPRFTCGAACPVPAQPPGAPTATVTSDVDVYDEPGGDGNVIGMLRQGEVVKVVKACPSDDWCALADGRFAWGQFFKNN